MLYTRKTASTLNQFPTSKANKKFFCDIAKKFIQSAPKAFLFSKKSSKFAKIESSRCILFFILTIEVLFHALFQKNAFSRLKMSTDMFIHFIEVCVG